MGLGLASLPMAVEFNVEAELRQDQPTSYTQFSRSFAPINSTVSTASSSKAAARKNAQERLTLIRLEEIIEHPSILYRLDVAKKMPKNEIHPKIDQQSNPTSLWGRLCLNKLFYSEASRPTPKSETERFRHLNEAECRVNSKPFLSESCVSPLRSGAAHHKGSKTSQERDRVFGNIHEEDERELGIWEDSDWEDIGEDELVDLVERGLNEVDIEEDMGRLVLDMLESYEKAGEDLHIKESDEGGADRAIGEWVLEIIKAYERTREELDEIEADRAIGMPTSGSKEKYERDEENLVGKEETIEKAIVDSGERRDSGIHELRELGSLDRPKEKDYLERGVVGKEVNTKYEVSEGYSGEGQWEYCFEEALNARKTKEELLVKVDKKMILDIGKEEVEGSDMEEWEQVLPPAEFDAEGSVEESGDAAMVIIEKVVATGCGVETDREWNDEDDWEPLSSPFEFEGEKDRNEDMGETVIVPAKQVISGEALDMEWELVGDEIPVDHVEESLVIGSMVQKVDEVDGIDSDEWFHIHPSIEDDDKKWREASAGHEENGATGLEDDGRDDWELVISPFQAYEEYEGKAEEDEKEAEPKKLRELNSCRLPSHDEADVLSDKGLAILPSSDKQLDGEMNTQSLTSSKEIGSLSEMDSTSLDHDDDASMSSLDFLIVELQDILPVKPVSTLEKFFKTTLKNKILRPFTRLFKNFYSKSPAEPFNSIEDLTLSNTAPLPIYNSSQLTQSASPYFSFPSISERGDKEDEESICDDDERIGKGERRMKRLSTYLKRFNCLG
ncbi:hypothetical protein HDU67_002237 [Dinochytrium kinnereticum]|nr:hypothetical protein HDU67_002237 [Dinochytrium kinnereticum]